VKPPFSVNVRSPLIAVSAVKSTVDVPLNVNEDPNDVIEAKATCFNPSRFALKVPAMNLTYLERSLVCAKHT
jgi:hypothetical protein